MRLPQVNNGALSNPMTKKAFFALIGLCQLPVEEKHESSAPTLHRAHDAADTTSPLVSRTRYTTDSRRDVTLRLKCEGASRCLRCQHPRHHPSARSQAGADNTVPIPIWLEQHKQQSGVHCVVNGARCATPTASVPTPTAAAAAATAAQARVTPNNDKRASTANSSDKNRATMGSVNNTAEKGQQ
jgi:hypothetical protein